MPAMPGTSVSLNFSKDKGAELPLRRRRIPAPLTIYVLNPQQP